jgi:anion-transporting  ArsA/GET3 family ATPase
MAAARAADARTLGWDLAVGHVEAGGAALAGDLHRSCATIGDRVRRLEEGPVSEAAPDLLRHRVLIVTGKGGTGKTSVAAALAELASARGIDTLAIEAAQDGALQRLLASHDAPPGDDGRTPLRLREHLFALRIDPLRALEEYLELQLHLSTIVRPLLRNRGFRRLLDAAPGWRELITLGKIWHLEQQSAGGAPRFGLLVVDAPATGHGISLLSVPGVVVDLVRMGPLRRQTEQVQALLRDPARTRIVPVTLAEELPVQETLELCAAADRLGLGVGAVFANAVEPEPGPGCGDAALRALAALPDETGLPALACPRALERIVDFMVRRARLQRSFLDLLRAKVRAPVRPLPRLLEPVADLAGARALAQAVEQSLASPPV